MQVFFPSSRSHLSPPSSLSPSAGAEKDDVLVKPAVEGTRRVLTAAAKAGASVHPPAKPLSADCCAAALQSSHSSTTTALQA